ncbi:MAG: sphingosine kinase [Actinomycetota bacterium]|nr:sphingosine kinase [Actinomycetota bacterium]
MAPRSDITLLVNPRAGHGRALLIAQRLATSLRDEGFAVDVPTVASVAAASAVAAEAVQSGDVGLVVIGGDGLCHLAIQELAGTGTALGIVPAGTGNDFAAGLGLPVEVQAAAAGVAKAMLCTEHRQVDLGRTGDRWWASVLCAGFDSAVNDRANRMRWPRGPRRYDLALLAEMARLRAVPMTLDLDGESVEQAVTLVAIGNTSTYGGGIPICPTADPGDGLLDVTVVGPISRARLIRITPTLRRGEHLAHPSVSTYQARSITLQCGADPIVTAYADGEPIQALPVTATCHPGALRILHA